MKKSLVKLLALCCAIVMSHACNKEQAPTPASNEKTRATEKAIEQLRTFRQQIEFARANPGTKSDETLSLSDALWDVENHFNLTYSDVECYCDQVGDHEFSLSVPVDDQQRVLVCDAVTLYEEVVSQARTALESDEFIDKRFVSLTIKEISSDAKGTLVKFIGKTGNRTNYNPVINHADGPFEADDNWMFAAPLGKCDDPDIPSGADEQFQEHLYAELIEPYIHTEEGYRNIYIDRRRFVFDGSIYPSVYYNTDPEKTCIDYVSMNDYYNGEKHTISQTIPLQYHLTGYSPISIEISGIMTEDGTAFTHYNEVEYGIRAKVCVDEFGTVESLIQ